MKDVLISIIVPVYNAEKYLDTCVESIIRQTYTNWELILVNDGSSDRSPEICEKWSRRDPRITVIHKENGGASSARNAGLNVARGEYIGFVDADDYISENMYRVMADVLENTERKMVTCACKFVLPSGEIIPGAGESAARDLDAAQGLKAILRGEVGISMCCRLGERDLFDSIRFPEGGTYEELPLMIPLLIASAGIYHTGTPLYYYRKIEGSVTASNWRKSPNIGLKRLIELWEQISTYGMEECRSEYEVYEGKSAYGMAILLDKHYDELDEQGRSCHKTYLQIMRRNMLRVFFSGAMRFKDIVLYLMILTRTLRPLYKLLGRL